MIDEIVYLVISLFKYISSNNIGIFSLYYDGIDNTTSIHNHFQLNELIENFNSSFWIESKWFFNYQYVDEESSDGGTVYAIDPYR
jgi:hypothetical protein